MKQLILDNETKDNSRMHTSNTQNDNKEFSDTSRLHTISPEKIPDTSDRLEGGSADSSADFERSNHYMNS